MRVIITEKDSCPLCGRPIVWSCHGKTGYAYCSRSPSATIELTPGSMSLKFCHWKGKCRRNKNGKIEFIYEIEGEEKNRE